MINTNELFDQMQQEFLERCESVENGYTSFLEASVENKLEIDFLTQLVEDRKAWQSENLDGITDEAEQYGASGYKGFLFKKQTREALSFKNIAEWQKAEATKKEIESRAKTALQSVRKGLLNVDENGEEIQLPEVTTTSFLKVDKVK